MVSPISSSPRIPLLDRRNRGAAATDNHEYLDAGQERPRYSGVLLTPKRHKSQRKGSNSHVPGTFSLCGQTQLPHRRTGAVVHWVPRKKAEIRTPPPKPPSRTEIKRAIEAVEKIALA